MKVYYTLMANRNIKVKLLNYTKFLWQKPGLAQKPLR
jgi:hypothetical protein